MSTKRPKVNPHVGSWSMFLKRNHLAWLISRTTPKMEESGKHQRFDALCINYRCLLLNFSLLKLNSYNGNMGTWKCENIICRLIHSLNLWSSCYQQFQFCCCWRSEQPDGLAFANQIWSKKQFLPESVWYCVWCCPVRLAWSTLQIVGI